MKKKQKILTFDEFFKYKEMFSALPEDKALAAEIFKNANYKDKDIVNTLMAKSLMFKERLDFCEAIKFKFDSKVNSYQEIYAFIKKEKADEIYIQILNKIRNE